MPPLNSNPESWLATRVKELEAQLAEYRSKDDGVKSHQQQLLYSVNEMGPRLDAAEKECAELREKLRKYEQADQAKVQPARSRTSEARSESRKVEPLSTSSFSQPRSDEDGDAA